METSKAIGLILGGIYGVYFASKYTQKDGELYATNRYVKIAIWAAIFALVGYGTADVVSKVMPAIQKQLS